MPKEPGEPKNEDELTNDEREELSATTEALRESLEIMYARDKHPFESDTRRRELIEKELKKREGAEKKEEHW